MFRRNAIIPIGSLPESHFRQAATIRKLQQENKELREELREFYEGRKPNKEVSALFNPDYGVIST